MEIATSSDGLVDFGRLARWMDERNLEAGGIHEITWLGGGTQNILVRFRRGERSFVLRRPPARPLGDGNKSMMREARILRALSGSGVPHPGLIAQCADLAVIGAAFYLMEPVSGFNPTVELPPTYRNPEWQRGMGFAMVDAILALGRLDYVTAGLASMGHLDGFLARQANRWRQQLESYRTFDGWPGPQVLPGVQEVGAWLDLNLPTSMTPGIVHGDFHLSNVMFEVERPRIAAVVDWELGTIGDPLLDLGWLTATWPDRSGADTGSGISVPGATDLTIPRELLSHYSNSTSRDLSAFPWYAVLACYKLGILQEGSHARACAGLGRGDDGPKSHGRAKAMMRRANSFMQLAEQRVEIFQ